HSLQNAVIIVTCSNIFLMCYCWGAIPKGYKSEEFSLKLLEKENVWMIPGSTYGKSGEGYVRISNVLPVERIAEAMEWIARFIS
ncbi:unnamed protein product, partial [marine sediment metagenome]